MASRKRTTSDATNLELSLGFDLPRASGVYAIWSSGGDKLGLYIGRTVNIHARWLGHIRVMRHGRHNYRMQKEYNEFGESVFSPQVLELCGEDECEARERAWLDRLFSGDIAGHYRRLNVSTKSRGPDPDVLSESQTRRWEDPEERLRQGEAMRRRYANPEERAKHSANQKIRFADPLTRAKMSRSSNLRYEDPAARAKKSEEGKRRYRDDPMARERNSVAQKKRYRDDPGQLIKNSEAQKKRWENQDLRQAKREEMIRRWSDPAEREKMTEANRRMWDNEESRKRQQAVMNARYEDPAEREKISVGGKRRFSDPAEREKQSKAMNLRWAPQVSETRSRISAAIRKMCRDGVRITMAAISRESHISNTQVHRYLGLVNETLAILERPAILRKKRTRRSADQVVLEG